MASRFNPLTEIPTVFWVVLLTGVSAAMVTYFQNPWVFLAAAVILAVAKAIQVAYNVRVPTKEPPVMRAPLPATVPGRSEFLTSWLLK
jgi:hypothetical protein